MSYSFTIHLSRNFDESNLQGIHSWYAGILVCSENPRRQKLGPLTEPRAVVGLHGVCPPDRQYLLNQRSPEPGQDQRSQAGSQMFWSSLVGSRVGYSLVSSRQ